ncbi:zinc metalloprotease HtpX [Methanobrevibacter sp. OttesenSCG-928-K11]|nr:zinc metalloprotease HtpX [Methanobrevibacter sp. OttesenSCG-928-K11]MDL2271001.1 zinc metalloprotease HtpX [Methanobrevibacter sp. OttesenSCG-928-I08]
MKGTWKLKLRLWGAMLIMFGMLYLIIMFAGNLLGYGGFYQFYAIAGIGVIFLQYLMGPKLVEMSMGVKPLSKEEAPYIHEMVEELSREAGIPKPKIGISPTSVPNAFAYGRSKRSGHVCITQGILGLLDRDELKAVLGHEMGHIKHNDMAITTIVSVIPMICYYIAFSFMFSRGDNNNSGAIIGILAFAAYFIGQLLVLFISRIREYYADEASVEFGAKPNDLASALYKLVYGASNSSEEQIKDIDGTRAFFLNDVNDAQKDIRSLRELDLDNNGKISDEELNQLANRNIKVKGSENISEVFSTHPNMLKRIKRLAELEK